MTAPAGYRSPYPKDPRRSEDLLFRRDGVNSGPGSSRQTGIYSADRIQRLNSARGSCRTFHHITAHPKYIFWRAARSLRSPEGSVFYVLRIPRVVVLTRFLPELQRSHPGSASCAGFNSESASVIGRRDLARIH